MSSTKLKWLSATFAFLAMLARPASAGTGGLYFDGVNDYVTFGAATNINNVCVSNFTVECWFKRQGVGDTMSGGGGGVTNGIPLVAKGRQESDGSRVDMNFFFGISTNTSTGGQAYLCADFEDYASGANHPMWGVTAITSNAWQHGAVTYDVASSNMVLYLNGVPDKTNIVTGLATTRTPRYDSTQHAAIAAALTSAGTADGAFPGAIDEVRIWNFARSAAQIAAAYNTQVTSGTGLIARWGLDETSGTTITNSISGGVSGTLLNGPLFTNGYFTPLVAPTISVTNPVNNATLAATSVTIQATASDADGTVTNVDFYVGNTLVGSDATLPYSATWSGVPPGVYALKAVVADNSGLSTTSAVVNITVTPPLGVGAIYFDGVNDYVTFGAAANLGVTNFTVECWFLRQGFGDLMSTGTGGVTNGIPLVSKGRQQVDNTNNLDMNFFLGLQSSSNVLAADFEDMFNGGNHPVFGKTAITSNAWQHAAVTYEQASGTWVLYLNGVPDATNVVTGSVAVRTPRGDSIQHAALASALQSTGAADGAFNGTMDEARVWNYARSAAEIAASYHAKVVTAAGLIGRWSLDDGTGLVVTNSGSSGLSGTLTNGPVWVDGFTFNRAPVAANDVITRTATSSVKVTTAILLANDSDLDGDTLTVTGVTPGSANGSVSLSGGRAFYTPLGGFTGNDSFTYAVGDGQGGTATGTVSVLVSGSSTSSHSITSLTTCNGTNKLLCLAGIPGLTYRVEATTNIVSSVWESIGSVTAGTNGLFEFVDTNASLYSSRLYRAAYP